jgi:deoxyribose-phosphate aldolase
MTSNGYDASYAKYCDHTVLRTYTSQSIVKEFCAEAIRYRMASVCVNPVHVAFVRDQLKGTGVKTCTVIGFPLGANTPAVKALEAADAIRNGAEEVDMVINIGALRDGNDELVYEDIRGVVEAARGKALVKVIIETCYLTKAEKLRACELCLRAGADFVKTSTGFGTAGATVEDIRLIRQAVGGRMRIKASTGVDDRETARRMIEAGADRLGLSRSVQVIEGDKNLVSATSKNRPPEVNPPT